jgi:hypothetical protein
MTSTGEVDRDGQTARQASAQGHEDAAARLYAHGDDALAEQERDLGRKDRESAGITAERAQVRRERDRLRSAESAGALGEGHGSVVAVEGFQPPDAEP